MPESTLEWRRLNDLPPPVLKRLPLNEEAVTAFGPPSGLHPPVKPARFVDEIPESYRGELYYRIVGSQRGSKYGPSRYVSLVEKKGVPLDDQLGQRLAGAALWMNHIAQGREQRLFAEPGELRPEFRGPLPARLLARARKPFPEYTGVAWPTVSARFRRIVEALEPESHLFIPLDFSDDKEERQLYVFFPGAMFAPTGLAVEGNDIAKNLLPNGSLQFVSPQHLGKRHFYLLNRSVIGPAHIFTDSWFGVIFSRGILELVGDVLDRELAFMPMGECNAPIPAHAEKRTRDGRVQPLGLAN